MWKYSAEAIQTRRKWEACQEIGVVMRPFLSVTLKKALVYLTSDSTGYTFHCCVYMVSYFIASNSGVTVIRSLRRGN